MAKKKLTRKELLKGEDEFITLSTRGILFVRAHLRELKAIGIGIVAVILIYLAAYTYLGYVNRKGQAAYNEAYYALVETLKPGGDRSGLKKADELFAKVMEEYSLSKAADLALPQAAYVKFLSGAYDEAGELYRRYLDEISENPHYRSLATLGLSACYEAKGEYGEAAELLKPLLEDRGNPFRDAAMLALARIHRLRNQPEKEKALLEKFVKAYPDSPFLAFARSRL
ncbi:MAG: tetratricopeptide repeat protein [Deltaproteobacteria bacterium]|nr:tetratricopeptide repeat protein [Deltaproteobacteria bacterium]